MNLILKNAIIVDSKSNHHFQKKDILIEFGIIKKIENDIKPKDEKVISFKNLHVSKGCLIVQCHSEPGFKEREIRKWS